MENACCPMHRSVLEALRIYMYLFAVIFNISSNQTDYRINISASSCHHFWQVASPMDHITKVFRLGQNASKSESTSPKITRVYLYLLLPVPFLIVLLFLHLLYLSGLNPKTFQNGSGQTQHLMRLDSFRLGSATSRRRGRKKLKARARGGI